MMDLVTNFTTWWNEPYMVNNGFMALTLTYVSLALILDLIRFGKRHG